jgi:hypothetical protein
MRLLAAVDLTGGISGEGIAQQIARLSGIRARNVAACIALSQNPERGGIRNRDALPD